MGTETSRHSGHCPPSYEDSEAGRALAAGTGRECLPHLLLGQAGGALP